jgi:MarR family transcriptional regulator, transcriptional regulator for hemolysin
VLEYDFEESVGYWICMSAHLFERAMNEELAPEGITYRQVQVLGWLALKGSLSQTELAERMNIEPPTLVGILDRMASQDWISREAYPDDRRRKLIVPLPKAEHVWAKVTACARRIRARAAHGLDEHQMRTLKELLAVVQENLGNKVRNAECEVRS